ncbi:MAG: flagellar assembly protein FliX [Beijerinckiaceae bacterium]
MRGQFCPMRITDKPGVGATGSAKPTGGARGTGSSFSLGGTTATERPQATQGAAPAGALDGLLALQAAGDSLERRKRSMRRGRGLLDRLDEVKIGLLSGRLPLLALTQLATELKQRREATDDAELDELLAHIDLRAEVELAKLARR